MDYDEQLMSDTSSTTSTVAAVQCGNSSYVGGSSTLQFDFCKTKLLISSMIEKMQASFDMFEQSAEFTALSGVLDLLETVSRRINSCDREEESSLTIPASFMIPHQNHASRSASVAKRKKSKKHRR